MIQRQLATCAKLSGHYSSSEAHARTRLLLKVHDELAAVHFERMEAHVDEAQVRTRKEEHKMFVRAVRAKVVVRDYACACACA